MPRVVVQTDKHVAGIIKDLWDDRTGFVKHIIGASPKANQVELLDAFDEHDHIAIRSGINTGKSTSESWLILHYICCRPESKILCTSPSKDQLYSVLWAELNMWHKRMNPLFRDMFIWQKTQFVHKEHPNWFATARTATKDNPQSLAGIHARYVMRIIDEASAVFDEAFDVIEGATGTEETKELMCGNPTHLSGAFYDAFHKSSDSYHRVHWNCLDNLASLGGMVPDRTVERIAAKYGTDSNMYKIRVLGEFPARDGDSFIPFDWAQDALLREVADQKDYGKVFGCDIARFGADSTVVAIRQGDEFKPYYELKNKSTMETAGFIAMLANKEKPTAIFIDVIGIGAGVYDRLSELGFPVIPVNVSESPAQDERRYHRLRDELWGNMRDWLEMRRGRLWDNEEKDLLGELTTPRYRVLDSTGKIRIETKDEMKKRLGKDGASPNIADAHNLTFAQPVSEYRRELDGFRAAMFNHGRDEGVMAYALDEEAGY